MSGFTRMCGEDGGTPLHVGYPMSDAIGGLFGALGVLAALYPAEGTSGGARPGNRLLDDRGDAAHARIPRHRI